MADEPPVDHPLRTRATIDLTDGSRLIGTTADQSLRLALDYAEVSVPLSKIRRWDAIIPKPGGEKDNPVANKITVQLTNGDRVTGTLNQSQLQFDTILGTLTPKLKFVSSVSYSPWREDNMPPGKGDLAFGGRNWLAWRTEFAIDGDRLKTAPRGYEVDHPRIDLLRHRSLTVMKDYGFEPIIHTPKLLDAVRADWKAARPLVDWVTTRLG